jgi:hypothetical protein
MVITLIRPLPLRLKSPIINNVISRSKYELHGIRENHIIGGLSLPPNDNHEKNHLKYITNDRTIEYKIDNNFIVGFKYFCGIKCWSMYEINYVKNIIEEEINSLYSK